MAEQVLEVALSADVPSRGGSFLFQPVGARPFMTPEKLSEEQRQFFKTGDEFLRAEVMPRADQLEQKDNALLRELLGKAGELGLLGVDVPEEFGGLAQDKVTSMLVAESQAGGYASWATTFGAHTGIGTLPIVFFGTPEQKARYLRQRQEGRGVCPLGGGQRLRRARREDGGEAFRRRQPLCRQRRQDVDHQRRLRRRLRRLPQDRGQQVYRAHRRARHPGVFDRPRGAQARHPRQLDHAAHLRGLQGAGRERPRRDRQGPQDRFQHPQCRAAQAGGVRHRRHEVLAEERRRVRRPAQAVRKVDRRVRAHPREVRPRRRADLRHRVDDLPRRRRHRRGHRRAEAAGRGIPKA